MRSLLLGALVLAVTLAPAHAQNARDVRDVLAGTWTLLSIYEENASGLLLVGGDARGELIVPVATRFVFVRAR